MKFLNLYRTTIQSLYPQNFDFKKVNHKYQVLFKSLENEYVAVTYEKF